MTVSVLLEQSCNLLVPLSLLKGVSSLLQTYSNNLEQVVPTQLVFIYNSLRTDLLQISGYNLFAGLLQLARFYASKITFRHLFDVIIGFI